MQLFEKKVNCHKNYKIELLQNYLLGKYANFSSSYAICIIPSPILTTGALLWPIINASLEAYILISFNANGSLMTTIVSPFL